MRKIKILAKKSNVGNDNLIIGLFRTGIHGQRMNDYLVNQRLFEQWKIIII